MYKNKVVSLLWSGKRDHFKKFRTASYYSPKEFWKLIKKITKTHHSSIPTLSHEGKTATSSRDKAKMLNNTCFNTMVPPLEDPMSLLTCIGSLNQDPDNCPPDLCTEEEVYELLVNLEVTKANGPDGISVKI